jgi:cobalt-zinc-cadmium efflux system protein
MSHGAHSHSPHDRHDHAAGGHSHSASGNRGRVLFAAILTSAFMVAEAIGGILTGSLALLADAGHMLTDAVALVLAYAAYRVSERPGTSRMTYGFDRLKILVAYTNGLTVLGIAIWIVVEAVQRLATPSPVLGGTMLLIAAAGLAVNLIVLAVLHGGDRGSLNLRGAILHVLGDLLGSAAAIAAAGIIILTGWLPADPLLSIVVAVLLVRSAIALMRESSLILLEGSPSHIARNAVADDLVSNVEGIANVHHMHVWSLDDRRLIATLHTRLRPGADADAAIAAIKLRLAQKHSIGHATIEVETGQACPEERLERIANGTP